VKLTNTRFVALLLGVAVLAAVGENLFGQTWQPKWVGEDGVARSDWEHRVLRQSQSAPPAKTSAFAGETAGRPAERYQLAQRPTAARGSLALTGAAEESAPASLPKNDRPGQAAEVIPPGEVQLEPLASDGVFAGVGAGAPGCGAPGCGDGEPCFGPDCGPACDFGWEVFDGRCGPLLRGLSAFVGADGFKGPLDRGVNGSFGLNEGVNLARPLGDPWGCGYQIGANFVQSNFSGAPTVSTGNYNLRAPMRRQYFATAGIFNRALHGGFQWGVAYDYLHDIFYQDNDLQQLRSLTGFVFDDIYEVGYYGVYGVGTDRTIDGRLDPTDMFVCYLRRNFENGGDGRIWGGATGRGDGLLGVDLWVPLGRGFALENRINYMIPKEGRGDVARTRESWGLVAQLVWYPGQNAKCQQQNPYRPIFNVADNSLFMVDRLAP